MPKNRFYAERARELKGTSSTGALVRICPGNIFTIWDAINGSFRRAPPSMARRVGKSKTAPLSGTCNLSGQKCSKLEFAGIWNLDLLNLRHVLGFWCDWISAYHHSDLLGSIFSDSRMSSLIIYQPIFRDRLQFLVDFLSASWSIKVRLHSRKNLRVWLLILWLAMQMQLYSWTNALTCFGGLHVCASSRNLTSKRWQSCNQTTAVSFTS